MQPRIVQMRLHITKTVQPQRRIRNHMARDTRPGSRDPCVQLCRRRRRRRITGVRQVEERSPGAGVTPSRVVCVVDCAQIGLEDLATVFTQRGVGERIREPGLGRERSWWREGSLREEICVEGEEVGVSLGECE